MKKTKKLGILLLLTFSITLFIFCACKENVPPTPAQSDSESQSEGEDIVQIPEKDLGSLKYTPSADGSTVTISYVYNGEPVSYTVPNDAKYISGGFAATDDLGRTLPNSLMTGVYGDNGEHYVGIFYFLWHGEHGDDGIYNLEEIMAKYGDLAKDATAVDPVTGEPIYGPIGAMHFFAEPLYGYYYGKDGWVMRKHMELLANAGVDFLYIDVTNTYTSLNNVKRLMSICHDLNEQGYEAPKIVFYTKSGSAKVMRRLYDDIYAKNHLRDTWFFVDGKPVIIGTIDERVDKEVRDFFTIKHEEWPNERPNENSWPWMEFSWPQPIHTDATGTPSAISVSIAQHNQSVTFSDSSHYGYAYNRGRSFNAATADAAAMEAYRAAYDADPSLSMLGLNFQAQWDRAIEADVPFVLVTGWNEWVAQRLDGAQHRGDPTFVHFVDTSSIEFSRDADIMRGGYFDNYYMQLIQNIQRLKGSAPVIVQDAVLTVDLNGGFEQWNDIVAKYVDTKGDTALRSSKSFGNILLENYTGNNDILEAKVTRDSSNLYFYVKTRDNIEIPQAESSWMQLYVNTDGNATNGWYGFDYLINASRLDETTTTVAACGSNEGVLSLTKVGEVNYVVTGNEMMIKVPASLIGVEDTSRVYLEFKWADADEGFKYSTMEDFYEFGDVAPLGRLNWIYQTYIPE